MYILYSLINGVNHVLHSVLFFFSIIIAASIVMTLVNASTHNPLVRMCRKITATLSAKIHHYLPKDKLEFAPAITLAILILLQIILPSPLFARINSPITSILSFILIVYNFIVFARIIISWVQPDPRMPLVKILVKLTEPALKIIRQKMPLINGMDFSPIALLFVIEFIQKGLLPIIDRLLSAPL